jgi:hypothetical protein
VNAPRVSWPPPGLEPLQGVIWPLIRSFAIGSALFAAPLLVGVATEQRFNSLGPFGTSYWIPAALMAVAVVLLLAATLRLSRAFRASANAARLGYDARTIALVAVDGPRDTGFILQRAGAYEELSDDARRTLLFTRAAGAVAYLAAVLWLPFGASLALWFAYNGWVTRQFIWVFAVGPSMLLLLVGFFPRAIEGRIQRRVRKHWKKADRLALSAEAAEWREQFAEAMDAPAQPAPASPTPFRLASFAVVIPAILLLAPVLVIGGSTVSGPMLARLAPPNDGMLEARFRNAALFRIYSVPPDSSISPESAGNALVNLMQMGQAQRPAFERSPQTSYPPLDKTVQAFGFRRDSIAVLLRGHRFSGEQLAAIRLAAAHPAHAEIAFLAKAPAVDIVGTRYVLPFPDSVTMWVLPIPRFGQMRQLAAAHVMLGYQHFLEGRTAEAERSMRETVSVGLLLIEQGVTTIESLIGRSMMQSGLNGLYVIQRASGKDAAADVLAAQLRGYDQVNDSYRRLDLAQEISSLPGRVTNPTVPRSIGWSAFTHFNVFGPCINLNRSIFPTNQQYERWLERSRASLIRYPADSALFELARKGGLSPRRGTLFRCAPPRELLRSLR